MDGAAIQGIVKTVQGKITLSDCVPGQEEMSRSFCSACATGLTELLSFDCRPVHQRYVIKCTIEMLENGGCSHTKRTTSNQEQKNDQRIRREIDGPKLVGKIGKKSTAAAVHEGERGRVKRKALKDLQPPSAGTVVEGWAHDVGSLF